ncbi:MAG: hypothetical protein LBP53_01815 [Candidatus Peribacteria bacterium]|jgi:CRISPR-associated protein Cpf1|nr:hypothetical protein [Candidatus Peribacteria bacterium]
MPTPSTIFSSFAGKFPLSKTLRFALLPQGNTLANFQSHKVLQHDEQRKKDYQTIKPLFDTLHETFIQQSLEKSQIDWSVFFTFYTTYLATLKHPTLSEKEKTDLKAEFSSYLAKLRKEIVALYTTTAEQWKANFVDTKGKPLLKGNGYNILTENGILEVLKKEYETDSEKKQVITNFKGFFTYFKGFNENRKNYYSDEEKATAVSYRIVNENLLFFCDNILLRDKLVNVELTDEEKQIFDSTFYNRCLTQEGIERYNALL